MGEISDRLAAASSREAARAYLDGLRLSKTDLQVVAHDLGVPVRSGESKGAIVSRIVEDRVGARLDHEAITGRSWR